ncbi:MAG TPA: methylated-DNA--[protein]-cysteine S-methyltransferase [Gemmatimonadales bacterium]|nr:methylated-DNA--[protein]-cysteine S-methyltransferase [Gemmatimonadales bacterium]
MNATAFSCLSTPVGELTLTASDAALTGVYFPSSRQVPRLHAGEQGAGGEVLALARRQLEEYFAGSRTTFELPLALAGTPFELRVWEMLQRIPYGTTTSYGELARRLDEPSASRAVGTANARNPIPIIVPCHRVIGANGDLTGYGGGLDRKLWLLEHEGCYLPLR